jgi:hypothetical protein
MAEASRQGFLLGCNSIALWKLTVEMAEASRQGFLRK